MSVDAKIVGGPTEQAAVVGSDGALRVASLRPPSADRTRLNVEQVKQFVAFLKNSSGSQDMTVDGSSTVAEFYVEAENDRIKWIEELRLVFHDTNMKLDGTESRRFGSAAASPGLTNGLRLRAEQGGVVTDYFADPVQSIGEFYRYSGGPGFGSGVGTGIINDVDGIAAGTDLLIIRVGFRASVGLFPGSIDRVLVQVRDDLTSLTLFECQAYGTQELL